MTAVHHSAEDKGVIDEFFYVVNMPIASIERWLDSDEAQAVERLPPAGVAALKRCSGRRIVELLHKARADYDATDIADMREVVRSVHHQLAERPAGDVHDSPWRHALMCCGHDPLTGRH